MNDLSIHPSLQQSFVTSSAAIPKLAIIRQLLHALHTANIRYCHWKSNEHLAASMTGDTDLDILFDEEQSRQVASMLLALGFKKFCSVKEKQYNDIEDFLGLDVTSGKVVHVHAHFRLTLGEPYLKGYQLSIEKGVLNSRVYDQEYDIFCSQPAFELVLLYIREALKIRNRDLVKIALNRRKAYSENILKEYRWLKQRCEPAQIEGVLRQLFTNYLPVYQLMLGDFTPPQLQKLSSILQGEFKENRLYSPLKANLLRWYREVSVKVSRKLAAWSAIPIIAKRINPRGGLTIAIIGADGSGKSTISTNLEASFTSKLDVYRVYLGRGDGRKSWARKILGHTKDVADKAAGKSFNKGRVPAGAHQRRGFVAILYKCLQALLVAYEKHQNLKLIGVAKKKGMLVICDRYPQNQQMGYNDGPLLHHLSASKNPLLRVLAALEARVYARAAQSPPDLVIKLIAEAAIVEARKPGETSPDLLALKIEGVKKLHFSAPCRLVQIDASMPLQLVLEACRTEVWKAYA